VRKSHGDGENGKRRGIPTGFWRGTTKTYPNFPSLLSFVSIAKGSGGAGRGDGLGFGVGVGTVARLL
jgi:hypothetical protein